MGTWCSTLHTDHSILQRSCTSFIFGKIFCKTITDGKEKREAELAAFYDILHYRKTVGNSGS